MKEHKQRCALCRGCRFGWPFPLTGSARQFKNRGTLPWHLPMKRKNSKAGIAP
jgi:hypothetical protein